MVQYHFIFVCLLLARLMGQYCFVGWHLSSSVVVFNAVGGKSAAAGPGAWAVRWPTLHGVPVRLRPVRATPCYYRRHHRHYHYPYHHEHHIVQEVSLLKQGDALIGRNTTGPPCSRGAIIQWEVA